MFTKTVVYSWVNNVCADFQTKIGSQNIVNDSADIRVIADTAEVASTQNGLAPQVQGITMNEGKKIFSILLFYFHLEIQET